nr:unnamed protein product [Callosobruchus analis]
MTTLTDATLVENTSTTCASKTLKKFTLPSPTCEISEATSMPDSPAIRLAKSIEALRQGFLGDRNLTNKLPGDLPTIEAFPYLTDDFLEKLGLDDRSPDLQLSKEDTEKIFKSLTLQLNLNMEDVMERLEQQQAECERQHKRCFYLIKDISTRLRDHRCIGATDPINPVFVLLEDIRFLLQETIKSTGKLGIITCEKRMAKCWRLIIDHVQILRSELECKNVVTNEKQCQTEFSLCTNNESDSPPICPVNHEKQTGKWTSSKSMYVCIIVLLLTTFGLLTIHLSCYYAIDYETCLMNNFVQEEQIGEPPY